MNDMDKSCSTHDKGRYITNSDRGEEPSAGLPRTLAFLPLRYAVICGSREERSLLPELPNHLREPNKVVELEHASYSLRLMRKGYLYVMVDRRSRNARTWESRFHVSSDGSLWDMEYFTPIDHQKASTGLVVSPTWMIEVQDVTDVSQIRLLFSPNTVSEKVLERYLMDDAYLGALQPIDVCNLINPSSHEPQPGTLASNQLECIADFAAERDGRLHELLSEQVFWSLAFPSLSTIRLAMEIASHWPGSHSAAMVVDDPIGITQALNSWRNKALIGVDTSRPRPSNVKQVDSNHATSVVESFKSLENLYESEEFKRAFKKRYDHPFNQSARILHSNTFGAMARAARASADMRAAEHVAWASSESLLTALDAYDCNDLWEGLNFTEQLTDCIAAMEHCAAGADLFEQWWQSPPSARSNLAMRGTAFNQPSVLSQRMEQRPAGQKSAEAPILGCLRPEHDSEY